MVSLVFVTFNRASRVALSLQDILNQTFEDFELIICDDGSTDGTSEICRAFAEKDPRITYIRQERNLGMPGNVNVGIKKAKYSYIGILHDGDRFDNNLIERWYQGITSDPDIGIAFCNIVEINSSPPKVLVEPNLREGIHLGKDLLKDYYFKTYSYGSIIYGMAMFRSEFAKESGGFSSEYGFYADVDFWMNILHQNKVFYCNDSLIRTPSKEVQPRVFDDRQIKTLLNLHKVFLKHRMIFCQNKPVALLKELLVHYAFLIFRFMLILRYLAENGDYRGLPRNFAPLLAERSFLLLLTPFWCVFRLYFLATNR
jgi:glycosyltransferase involved in cell wall biosynthesis